MAEETQKTEANDAPQDGTQADSPEKSDAKANSQKKGVARVLNSKVIAVLVVLTVIINIAGLVFQSVANSGKTAARDEHDLGTYHFLADPSEKGLITAAEFNLHIAILDDIEKEARRRLDTKKFRVQQDIEELLRKAHGGDFDDPSLGELKRRLQARINETLGMMAIADVIVTDLKLDKIMPTSKPSDETSQSLPWIENSSL